MQNISHLGLVFWLACVNALLPLRAFAADATPQEVLKSKGLSPVGQKFLLEDDRNLAEWMRAVAAAERKVQDANKQRANIEREIRNLEGTADQLYKDWAAESDKLSKIGTKAVASYNKQLQKVNADWVELKATLDQIKKRHASLQSIGDPSGDYVALTLKFAAAMDLLDEKYKSLAEDAEVKAAINKINQAGAGKVTLGPSERLSAELPAIRKLRDKVNSDTVRFEIRGGVPTVPVTLNGTVQVQAVFDSGAASVTISEKLAKQLNLTPAAGDRKVHMMTADGSVSEVRVMQLKSIRLGRFTVEDVECIIVPSKGKQVDTLLGGTFLRHFVYRMNLDAGQIHLSQILDRPANGSAVAKTDSPAAAQPNPASQPSAAASPPVTPAVATPPAAAPIVTASSPPPAAVGPTRPTSDVSGFIAVGTLESKKPPHVKDIKGLFILNVTPHDKFWTGANGVAIPAGSSWSTSGSVWVCNDFQMRPWGATFVHPFGKGHILIQVAESGILFRNDGIWTQKNGGVPLPISPDFKEKFPLRDKKCVVRSELAADGTYKLTIDGILTATAKVTEGKPMQIDGIFQGAALPATLPAGHAAVIVDHGYRFTSIAGDLSLYPGN